MGDGKTFDQAVRALDKLIAEQARDFARVEPPRHLWPDPARRASEQMISAATATR